VSATNAAGTSIASTLSNTVVPAAGPLPPTGILYTNYSNGYNTPLVINGVTYYDSVVLTWIASVSNGSPIMSYLIRSSNNGAYIGSTPVTAVTPDQNNRIYQTVRFLPLGGNCTFTIDATNALSTSTQAAFATPIAIMNVPNAPAAPTLHQLFNTLGRIDMRFIFPNSNGSASFTFTMSAYILAGTYIYIKSVSGNTSLPDGSSWQVTFESLAPNRTYYFAVQVRNALGASAISPYSQGVYIY
jgi:predicted phage tail protein